MRYLRTNTACRVTVGPFFDKTDGITPETALTVTNEKLTFMVDTANVPTLILDTAPTASGGANDMVHVTGDDAGFYDLELADADVNYLGRAMLALTDAANHCPVFHEFMILPAVIYDSMVLGTDLFDVSATQILGTAISTPATAGILDVNLKNIANAAVSTSTAQLGVNAVQIGAAVPGSATIGTVTAVTNAVAITANQAVNVAQWGGSNIATPAVTGEPVVTLNATQAAYTPAKAGDAMLVTAGTGAGQLDFTSGVIKANLVQILAATITGTAANLVAAFTKWFNVTSPTGTVNSIPDAVAGASGGLPTTNGTKLSQTADLTSGQSIACSDKTGFSLAATGLDLVTAASTFGAAMIAGIWAAATSAMTTVGSIGKKLADWVVGTIDTYTGNTKQTGDAYAIVNNGTYGNSALHTEVAKEATLTAMKGTDNKILISTDAQDLSGTLSVNAKKLNGQTPPLGSDNKMQITTDAMTEAYAADGVAPSVQQSLFQIMQFLHEASVSGTTVTVKKVNGSTTAYTLTINDATTPTSITRAT